MNDGRRWIWIVAPVLVVALFWWAVSSLRAPSPMGTRLDMTAPGPGLRTITVHTLAPDSLALVPAARQTLASGSRRDLARELVTYLSSAGPEGRRPLPEGTELLHFFAGQEGEITLDLSSAVTHLPAGSVLADRMRLSALVRTFAENMPEATHIRLLVEGRPMTVWGRHIRLDPVLEVRRWL